MSKLKMLVVKVKDFVESHLAKPKDFVVRQIARIRRHRIQLLISLAVALIVAVWTFSVYFSAQQQLVSSDGYKLFVRILSFDHLDEAWPAIPYVIASIFGLVTFTISQLILWKVEPFINQPKSN